MNNIFKFYLDVIDKEANENGIAQELIEQKVMEMRDKYTVDGLKTPDAVDFNLHANIHAYIYIYATCHTRMMIDSLRDFWNVHERPFTEWIRKLASNFKICAIGGGPGCDILAILHFLKEFEILPSGTNVSCVVVDKYTEWQLPYYKSFDALREHGLVSDCMTPEFIDNDLFEDFSDSLNKAIGNSDLITMCKFVSSVCANQQCGDVLKKIVGKMKPGALLFFIDNSGGEAYKKMKETAAECNMESAYGPKYYANIKIKDDVEPKMYDDLYISAFHGHSKRNANIVAAVWQKLADNPFVDSAVSFVQMKDIRKKS